MLCEEIYTGPGNENYEKQSFIFNFIFKTPSYNIH